MGKRKRSQRTTAVTAEHPPAEQEAAADDGDDGEEIVLPKRAQRASASSASSSSSFPSATAAAGEQDEAADEDELSVRIIERPAGFTPPSRASFDDSDGDDSEAGSSDSEDEEEDGAPSLHINAAYAAKYESEKRQQEMSRKAQRGRRQSEMMQLLHDSVRSQGGVEDGDGSADGEEAEDEDEDEEEDDSGSLLTPALDVKIHETLNAIKRKDPIVYDASRRFFAEEEEEEGGEGEEEQKQAETTKPAVTVRDLLLQSMQDDDEEEEEREEKGQQRPLTHVQEQHALKQSLLKATQGAAGEEEDDELFTVRVRDSESSAAPLSPSSSSAEAPLSSAEFLRSFLSEQWWRQPASALPSYERIKGEAAPPLLLQPDSEDDAEVEAGEEWEQRYNFRYQEEGGSRVQTYPRDIADSLRRKDDRRKVRREKKRERKEQERRRQEEELKRLKRERMRQLEERLAKIAEAGGVELQQGAAATRLQLDGAWDAAEHERAMAAMYGQDYYDQQPDDDEAIAQLLRDDQAEDGDAAAAGRHRPLSFASASASASLSAARQQGLDAVYALDYEDVIADGLRTRFHYTQVAPDSFGLTLQQLLQREDRELNKIVGLKKLAPYRGEADDAAAAGGSKRSKWSRWAAKAGLPHDNAAKKKRKKQKVNTEAGKTVSSTEGSKPPKAGVQEAAAVQTAAVSGKLSERQKRRLREKKRKAATGSADGGGSEPAAPAGSGSSKQRQLETAPVSATD